MNILCAGINHTTAPVELREKLWFSNEESQELLKRLLEHVAKECVVVSTCNRTELYVVPQSNTGDLRLWQHLAAGKSATGLVAMEHFYEYSSEAAVHQLMKVSTGIDSMALGDVQILGQVKEAFAQSQELRTIGPILSRLFSAALHAGKRARAETEIGEGAVSISYAAAELSSKIFEDLSTKTALLIGAGETGELTAKHLRGRHLGSLLITNRTTERAESLALALDGSVIAFDKLREGLKRADIVISCVAGPGHVLSKSDLTRTIRERGNRPLVIIDIGVPRNIDPEARRIDNVFLHDIDTLQHIIDRNLDHRLAEVPHVEQIIREELSQFQQWYAALDVAPTIQRLREQFEEIRTSEIEKNQHRFDPKTREEVDLLTKRIINKILHAPMMNLRNGSQEGTADLIMRKLDILRHLFGLDKKRP